MRAEESPVEDDGLTPIGVGKNEEARRFVETNLQAGDPYQGPLSG